MIYSKMDMDKKSKENLEEHIQYVIQLLTMKSDRLFQKFIQNKVLQVAQEVTNQRLVGGTSNDDVISEYSQNHKIREEQEGFILYNDTMIPAEVYGVQNDISNYPDGQFCVALAFEYGVGIIGENTPNNDGAWAYNKKGYNFGWYLPKSVTGEVGVQTGGYMGFEIYRYIAIEVEKRLMDWVNEYCEKKEV